MKSVFLISVLALSLAACTPSPTASTGNSREEILESGSANVNVEQYTEAQVQQAITCFEKSDNADAVALAASLKVLLEADDAETDAKARLQNTAKTLLTSQVDYGLECL